MANSRHTPGIEPRRLEPESYRDNFADLHPPLSGHEAAVEADRCYFCYDAPCIDACPTGIDIPLFIRQISSGAEKAAAMTIFDSNILGGMCARVCPTESLCEEACVREAAEGRPVEIGRLQRFATDAMMATGDAPLLQGRIRPERSIAVVGAGPAGLACAHRLAMKGHDVSVFDSRPKPGGLNEYGIAAYKTVDGFAAREVDWLLEIGGISLHVGAETVGSARLEDLMTEFDAVFLGFGLAGVNSLAVEGSDLANVENAVGFIADLRQAPDLSGIPVGRDVIVLGGGMTAVDAAVQSKLLGAQSVTIAYRGARQRMSASGFEQDLAASKGVRNRDRRQTRQESWRKGKPGWWNSSGRKRPGTASSGPATRSNSPPTRSSSPSGSALRANWTCLRSKAARSRYPVRAAPRFRAYGPAGTAPPAEMT